MKAPHSLIVASVLLACGSSTQDPKPATDLGIVSCATLSRVSPYDIAILTNQPLEVVQKVQALCRSVEVINSGLEGLAVAGGSPGTVIGQGVAGNP